MTDRPSYIGRFAPSPTGPLHLGSLVAAMASYLDAKAHHGQWLVRIEDVDGDRNVHGADAHPRFAAALRHALGWRGHAADRTHALYQHALEQLGDLVYPCGCSRREIADSQTSAQTGTEPDLSGHLPQRPGAGQGRPRAAPEGAAVAALRVV
jgi:glutamyl-Q tRNA(Asp) synthetase